MNWTNIIIKATFFILALTFSIVCITYSITLTPIISAKLTSIDSFIGITTTLIGIMVTFAIGFQIYNALEIKTEIKSKLNLADEKINNFTKEFNNITENLEKEKKELLKLRYDHEIAKLNFDIELLRNSETIINFHTVEGLSELINYNINHIYYTFKRETLKESNNKNLKNIRFGHLEIDEIGTSLKEIFKLQTNKSSIILSIPEDYKCLSEIDNKYICSLKLHLDNIVHNYENEVFISKSIDAINNIYMAEDSQPNASITLSENQRQEFIKEYASILQKT